MFIHSGRYFRTLFSMTGALLWSLLIFLLLQGKFTQIPDGEGEKEFPERGSVRPHVKAGFFFSAERSPESNVLSRLLRKRFFRYNFSKRKHQFSSGDPAPDPAAALPDPKRNFYEQKTDRTHLFSSNLAQLRRNTPVRAGPLKSHRI